MSTIGKELEKFSGLAPGFDALRVALALSVISWHSFCGIAKKSVDGDDLQFFWFLGYGILVMFFGLSGFLITGSAQRLKLRDFLVNRGLRIVPALAVEVVLSAFLLGAIFTNLKPSEYFTNKQTYIYLSNIVGNVNFLLPGVFENNRTNGINWSLWTIPHEIICYVIMAGIIILGITKSFRCVLAISVIFVGAGFFFTFNMPFEKGSVLNLAADCLFVGKSAKLYMAFLFGILIYQARAFVPYSWPIFIACLALFIMLGWAGPTALLSFPMLSLIAAPALVYATIFLGVTELPALPLFRRGDYSYGLYLYGMPIQQATAATFSDVTSPLGQLLLAFPSIIVFSIMSWHFVEQPILRRRKKFSFVARIRDLDSA